MHCHRSRTGVALVGAVAIVALCSTALPAFAVDRDLEGGSSLTATGTLGLAPSRIDTREIRTPGTLTVTGTLGDASDLSDGMGARGDVINDSCTDAPVDTLNAGDTLTYAGNNHGATLDCAALGALGDTWHAFDLVVSGDVSTDKCGTVPVWGNAFIVIDAECPCSGVFVFATAFDQVACADGNWTVFYDALPAGTWWAPEILDPGFGNEGEYVFNIKAAGACVDDADCDDGDACTDDVCNVDGSCSNDDVVCPEGEVCEDGVCVPEAVVCGPGNGDCCLEGGNGTPGCENEACCEMICADDSFCCDISWDGICADAAQLSCEVCQPIDCDPPCAKDEVCQDGVCVPLGDNIFNDNCEDAPVDTLNPGDTLTYEATNLGATSTCAALGALGDTWHAFDLIVAGDVSTDKCGTVPVWGNAFIVIDAECPCSGVFIFATDFDTVTCADGNWTVNYDALPAGDYWAPEILDPASGNEGKYIFNIIAGDAGPGGEGPGCFDNQECDDAFTINPDDTLSGNSCEDEDCVDGSASCGASDGADVWYTYTATCDGDASATTCADFKDYDTVLSVHSDCPGTIGNEIVCNDDDCDLNIFQSTVNWSVTAGTTYLIRVAGFAGGCGDFDLNLTEECGCVDDSDCPDDGDACTDDICVDGECVNPQIDCDDGDQCTDNFCTGDGECQSQDNGDCCEDCGTCAGDVNCDGMVDPLDSGAVLARFGLDPCTEENCRYDVNCDGSIDPLDSGFVLARFGLCDPPDVCKFADSCPVDTTEATDNCEDAPVNDLSPGETLNFFGDNTDATSTCAALGALGDTWHAFDLTETANVSTDKCGTVPVWGNAFIVIDAECPCSGVFIFATDFDQVTCADGNWTVNYAGLPAGDYWAPEILDPAFGNLGEYLFNISAQ